MVIGTISQAATLNRATRNAVLATTAAAIIPHAVPATAPAMHLDAVTMATPVEVIHQLNEKARSDVLFYRLNTL